MKFDPLSKHIYTDKGEFVKTMNCPYKMTWDNLEITNSTMRKCTNCDHLIVDTESISDEDLLKIVRQNPDTCLKIDLNQHNLKIVSNGIIG
jgi:Fe-S-cluster-containing dehydrogenase component